MAKICPRSVIGNGKVIVDERFGFKLFSRILVLQCCEELRIARYALDLSKSPLSGRTKQ